VNNLKIADTKTHKTGNSVSVTLPKITGFSSNESVTIEKVDEDTLIIRRAHSHKNPWTSGAYDNVDFRGQLDDIGFNAGNESRKGQEL
jgi:virulence-associated protein VagC